MDIFVRKTAMGFVPLVRDEFEQIANGTEGQVKFRVPRNYKFLKKYMAMLRATLERADVTMNMHQWRHIVTCGSGHCTYAPGPDGLPVPIPDSISFANMDEVEFQEVYRHSLEFICDNYISESADEMELWLEFAS